MGFFYRLVRNIKGINMYKYIILIAITVSSFNIYANDDEYLTLALELINIPEGEKLDELVSSVVQTNIQANPSIRPVRRAFEKYYREIFTSDEFKYGLARIQMELFTYEELLELKEVMKTPIFKKYVEVTPKFLTLNAQLGSRVVKNNEERLHELITKEQEHIEKLQQLDKELFLTVPE